MRTFNSGATRSNDEGKIDPEAALSPLVLTAYCEYVRSHRFQGSQDARSDDNWQLGISPTSYMKSLLRHVLEAWRVHRYGGAMNDILFAVMFNTMGLLHERLKGEYLKEIGSTFTDKDGITTTLIDALHTYGDWRKDPKYTSNATSNQKPQSLEERRQQASPQDGLASSPQPTIYPDDWPPGEL